MIEPDGVEAPFLGRLGLTGRRVLQALPHGLAHLELLVLVLVRGRQALHSVHLWIFESFTGDLKHWLKHV